MSNTNMNPNPGPIITQRPNNKLKGRFRHYLWHAILAINVCVSMGLFVHPYIASFNPDILAWAFWGCAWLVIGLIATIIDTS
ncbi:MAG: hypothetical protein ACPGWR_28630 [Ardenticatenaceae bacterium]